MKVMVDFFRTMLKMPKPWLFWLALLMTVNMLIPILFIKSPEGRMVILAAMAGAVQAHYVGIVTPNALFLLQMSLLVAMAVIGGIENFVAAAIGAILIQFVLEMLRNSFDIGGITVDMTIWRLVVFGILLMVTLRFSRNGLIAPIIDYFARGHVAGETVAARPQGDQAAEVGK